MKSVGKNVLDGIMALIGKITRHVAHMKAFVA
jgi:hypothetical protein